MIVMRHLRQLGAIGLRVVGLVAVLTSGSRSAPPPNILLIYTDDVGYGDVSCNGQQTLKTPHIDRIAAEGLRHTDAHCSAATCTPSRFALLTGRYAFRQPGTGIARGDANMIIQPGTTTVATLLKQVGYTTGVIGKWHLGLGKGEVDWNTEIRPNPHDIGFDYHYLIPATGDRVPCVYVEQGRVVGLDPSDPIQVSFTKRIDPSPSGAEVPPESLKQRWSHGHNQTIVNGISRIGWMTGGQSARWVDEEMADTITAKATTFLEEHRDEPFFLFFSTHDIHVPRVPHPRFQGKSGLGWRGDAMLQLDWCVGQLLNKLDELGLREQTLVIFTSDNGPVLDDGYVDQANELVGDHRPNGPFRAGKYSSFEGGTRVPMLIRWPQRIPAGQVSAALIGQVDFAASVAALVGAEIPAGQCIDSRNELDALLGTDPHGRPHLMHEARNLALRMGHWKYVPPGRVRDGLGPWTTVDIPRPGALFDLRQDVAERRDVADEHPEVFVKLQRLHERLLSGGDQPDHVGQ
ncbi:MAG: arylsulfatase [Pirellulaceae bacterium]|nr:MAG: arylsulfatase [Pirellulaceae bacterium]